MKKGNVALFALLLLAAFLAYLGLTTFADNRVIPIIVSALAGLVLFIQVWRMNSGVPTSVATEQPTMHAETNERRARFATARRGSSFPLLTAMFVIAATFATAVVAFPENILPFLQSLLAP